MASRRNLSTAEILALAETLQLAILDGIVRARRWGKHELAFQGGTSLHLAYGSPRASEDLDFVLGSDKGLGAIMAHALSHATAAVRSTGVPGAELIMKVREGEPPANPRLYTVSFKAPVYLETVRVRVEFYVTTQKVASGYRTSLREARLSGAAALRRPIHVAITETTLPVADLREIWADKIFAVAGREYLKFRDVFDLWWIGQQLDMLESVRTQLFIDALPNRQMMYPNCPTGQLFVERLKARCAELKLPATVARAQQDLERWLLLSSAGGLFDRSRTEEVLQYAGKALERAAAAAQALPGSTQTPPSPDSERTQS